MTSTMQDVQDALVLAALNHVPFDGWSKSALVNGAVDAGFDSAMAERAFPGGPVEAVAHLVRLADRRLEAEAEQAGLASLRTPQRIAWLVRRRIEAWTEHKESVRRAVSLLSLPGNAPLGLRLSWGTADALWYAAGDKAADFNYYTKRATLAAVYGATLMYWLDDASDNAAESWAFLDRRLGDVARLPKVKEALRQPFSGLMGGLVKGTMFKGGRGSMAMRG